MAGRDSVARHGAAGDEPGRRGTGGPLVVLVPGAVDSADSFGAVRRELAGLHTVSYDRRGYGSAWRLFTPGLTMAGHVDDLLAVIGDRAATVIGHSLGGLVAIGAALRRPDLVTAVGLYETAMPWASWWTSGERSQMLAQIEASMRRAASRSGPDPALAARRRSEWRACAHEVTGLLSVEPFRWQDLIATLTVGVGTCGSVTSGRDSRVMAARLGAELVELPGAGHLAHRTHPELFAGFVRRSVTRGQAAGA
jgi:pimeloyl-ACP methyl ester carboxylesterase